MFVVVWYVGVFNLLSSASHIVLGAKFFTLINVTNRNTINFFLGLNMEENLLTSLALEHSHDATAIITSKCDT